MSLVIRAATPQDVPAMSRVLTTSITALCAADHGNDPEKLSAWTRNKTEDGIGAMLARPNLVMLVAEREAQLVAVGAVTRDGEVALNYVAPEARFSGVSKAMLARLEAELNGLGVTQGRLEATATALKFYEACGWQIDGPQATGRMVNGYPMRKTIIT